jgi:hypothetical protein
MRKVLLTVLLCLVGGAVFAQNTNPPVDIRFSTPTRIRVGVETPIKVFLRNPYRDERITLTATASYLVGEAQVQASASVDITVDRSLEVSLGVGLGTLSLVNGSPTFDGQPVSGTRNNNNVWTFNVTIPSDGNEHALELRVIR